MRTQSRGLTFSLALVAALAAAAVLGAQGGGVTSDQLARAGEDPANWITYSGQYNSQRFSRLVEIDRSNVDRLELAWVRQLPVLGQVQTSPLVVDGIMYLTTPENEVYALDAATGNVFWSYQHDLSETLALCCSKQSRGVGILGDRLYLTTMDAHLIALDSATGTELWDRKIADHLAGYSMTAAPLVVKDMIVTGTGGGEYGIRGWVDAYDAETGERRWAGIHHPRAGRAGQQYLGGRFLEDRRRVDLDDRVVRPRPQHHLLGRRQPRPRLERRGARGRQPLLRQRHRDRRRQRRDQVALPVHAARRPRLGRLPGPGAGRHGDWRPRAQADAVRQPQRLLLRARPRDRPLRAGAEYAMQTWAQGLDDSGRPIRVPDMEPTPEGRLVFPDVNGASNWWSPSFSPATELFYTMAYDGGANFFSAESEYVPGQLFIGGSHAPAAPRDTYVSAVRAIDPQTARIVWEHRVQPKSMSGVMSTAGGLVFAGTVTGNFIALDASTGDDLWHARLGGNVIAAPITYLVNGRQQVTIAAGQAIFTFALGD